ncbi:MAG TPA: RDD family protein [Caldimonas sp.]|nr:RDD family protein [Caldimonas sp.]
MVLDSTEYEYVGFWPRVVAAIVDTILVLCIAVPLVVWLYGWDEIMFGTGEGFRPTRFAIDWLMPAAATLLFWYFRSATPGKLLIGARIVDAKTGGKPTTAQLVVRYLGYFVSTIPFCLGLLWVAFDARKQGFHDKLARTVVIRRKPEPVRFG